MKGSFTGATANHDGLFVAANGGTLFLDEISAMPLMMQGKFLRVLQDREVRPVGGSASQPVDVRVLAASNMELEKLVEARSFREDLYYRLAVIPLELPPLRERQEDILPLVQHFIKREVHDPSRRIRIAREAMDALGGYSWPGNVRELENAVKHAVAFLDDDEITVDILPPRIVSQAKPAPQGRAGDEFEQYRNQSLKAFLRTKEREYLEQVLAGVNGDKEQAAKALQISLATLYRKLPGDDSGPDPVDGQEPRK